MKSWTTALAIPDYSPEHPEGDPVALQKAPTEGGTLYVAIWGDGTERAPYSFQIFFSADSVEGANEPLDSRFPTLEEIQNAADTLFPEGVLFGHPPFNTLPPESRPAIRGLAGHQVAQVGVVAHSPAARRRLINIAHRTPERT